MPSYSFYDTLSPIDFERLVRDIVQIREGRTFELSKTGRDKGIDFESNEGGYRIIGQAKNYKNYKDLIRVLKHEEREKVDALQPDRYILATSVSLTNKQVEEIQEVFSGFIHSKLDVLGKDELNDLLGQPAYREVEKKYSQLWIASTNVLQNILDKTVYRRQYNIIANELDRIKSVAKIYVKNYSYDQALSILKSNRYVIISGNAGTGKTTLARMLALYFLEDDYELIVVSGGVSEAWELLDRQKKQIFLFDDFLGSFQFDEGMSGGRSLVELGRFIEEVSNSKDKLLILTTREYILQHGQIRYKDQLKEKEVNFVKCVVDVAKYTRPEKAEILFNHLYYSNIDRKYINYLAQEQLYHEIIEHGSYSPRLIEDFVNKVFKSSKDIYEYDWGNDFFQAFKGYLDDPYSYWESVFEKQPVASRILLFNLFIGCEPMPVNYLWTSFEYSSKIYKSKYNDFVVGPDTFNILVKELMDTFISIERYGWEEVFRFQNPSINDFLLEYLKRNREWIPLLIEGAVYWNQLTFIFTTKVKEKSRYAAEIDGHFIKGTKIHLGPREAEILLHKMTSQFDHLSLSVVWEMEFTDDLMHYASMDDLFGLKLNDIYDLFSIEYYPMAKTFLIERVTQTLNDYETGKTEKLVDKKSSELFAAVIAKLEGHHQFDGAKVIEMYYKSINWSTEFYGLLSLEKAFPVEYEEFWKAHSKSIQNDLKKMVLEDLEYLLDTDFPEEDHERDSLYDYQAKSLFEEFEMKMSEEFKKKMTYIYRRYTDEDEIEEEREDRLRELEIEEKEREQFQKKKEQEDEEIQGVFGQFVELTKEVDSLIDFPRGKEEHFCEYMERVLQEVLSGLQNPDMAIEHMKSLAFRMLVDGKRAVLPVYISDHLGDRFNSPEEVIEFADEINPILVEGGRQYRFANEELFFYLAILGMLDVSMEERREFIKNHEADCFDYSDELILPFWSIWKEINIGSFAFEFVQPLWENERKMLDFTSDRELFKSYGRFVKTEVDMCVKSEESDIRLTFISSGYDFEIDILCMYFSISNPFDLPSSFFDSQYIKKKENNDRLVKWLVDHYGEEEQPVFEVHLPFSKLASEDDEFFKLMKELGFIEDLKQEFHSMDKCVQELVDSVHNVNA